MNSIQGRDNTHPDRWKPNRARKSLRVILIKILTIADGNSLHLGNFGRTPLPGSADRPPSAEKVNFFKPFRLTPPRLGSGVNEFDPPWPLQFSIWFSIWLDTHHEILLFSLARALPLQRKWQGQIGLLHKTRRYGTSSPQYLLLTQPTNQTAAF